MAMISSTQVGLSCLIYSVILGPSSWKIPVVSPFASSSNAFLRFSSCSLSPVSSSGTFSRTTSSPRVCLMYFSVLSRMVRLESPRAGRIDRIGTAFKTLWVQNMFPDEGLEKLLGLVESLSRKIADIDASGFLDSSILGEIVHPQNLVQPH